MKRIARIAAVVVAVLLAAAVTLPFLIDVNRFRPTLEAKLTQALDRQVHLGNLKLAVFSGSVAADDLSVAEDPAFGTTPFLRARSFKVRVELWPLISSRELRVTALTIDQPQIVLLQTALGTWNFSSLGGKRAAATAAHPPASPRAATQGVGLSARLVKISGGRITWGRVRSTAPPMELDNVHLEVRDFSAASAFPFSFSAKMPGGAELKLDGKAGPVASDAAATPFTATFSAKHLDPVAARLLDRSTGMAGVASADGTASSDGRRMRLQGRLKAEKLVLAKGGSPASRPVELDFAVDHDRSRQAGQVGRGDLHIGKASVALTGSYNLQGNTPAVAMKLAGPKMPLEELAAMLPALHVVLPAGSSIQGGTASVELTSEGPIDRLVSNGALSVENTRLAGFDLGGKMAAVERLAGIKHGRDTDIQALSARLRSSPEGTTVEEIKMIAPAIGELSGGGAISPANALDFKMRAVLHTSGAIMSTLGMRGDTAVPFLIQGTAADPAFKPDMKSIMSGKIDKVAGGDTGKAASGFLKGLLGGNKQK